MLNNTIQEITPKKVTSTLKNILISHINANIKNWQILVRVTFKSIIHPWKNNNHSGIWFSFNIIDEKRNEIRCVCFNEEVRHFYNLIEIQNSFYISNAQIMIPKKEILQIQYTFPTQVCEKLHHNFRK